jgi:hypothetical protein
MQASEVVNLYTFLRRSASEEEVESTGCSYILAFSLFRCADEETERHEGGCVEGERRP